MMSLIKVYRHRVLLKLKILWDLTYNALNQTTQPDSEKEHNNKTTDYMYQ
jgi:hypothetical protein